MATKEFQRSLQESGQEAKARAEKRRDEMAARIEQNQQELAQTKPRGAGGARGRAD